MKLWKPIIGFVTHKKVLSSVIGIAMVGSVSAAAVAANNGVFTSPSVSSSAASSAVSVASVTAQLESSETSSSVSSAISSSASEASTASSTVSGKPSSVASSTPSKASTISTVSVDNTATRQKAISDENTRHNNALAAINSQYDPKIAAVKAQIQSYKDAGAQNWSQADLDAQQKKCDQYLIDKRNMVEQHGNHDYDQKYDDAYNVGMTLLSQMNAQKATYNQLVISERDLSNLQDEKEFAVDGENKFHVDHLDTINSIYP